jgi:hypothetical protein
MTMKAWKFQRGDVNKPNSGGGSLTEKDVLIPPVRIINAICHSSKTSKRLCQIHVCTRAQGKGCISQFLDYLTIYIWYYISYVSCIWVPHLYFLVSTTCTRGVLWRTASCWPSCCSAFPPSVVATRETNYAIEARTCYTEMANIGFDTFS